MRKVRTFTLEVWHMKRYTIGLAALAVLAATGCEQVGEPPVPGENLVTITEGWSYRFDALPGDRLDVVMIPEGDMLARCDDMGGVLRVDVFRSIATCEGVDF